MDRRLTVRAVHVATKRWRSRLGWIACLVLFAASLAYVGPVLAAQSSLIRISVSQSAAQADGASSGGVISGDGRYVAFSSDATNLVPGDNNRRHDIFRYDRQTGDVDPVSVTSAGVFLPSNHGAPVISGDGRYVAFWSEGVFDPADASRTADVFLKDMSSGGVERLTIAPDGSNKVGEDRFSSTKPLAMSDDGRWVAFQSGATNLVAGDTEDEQSDLYVRDRFLGVTTLLSTEPTGGPGPSGGVDLIMAGSGAQAVAGFRVLSSDRSTDRMVVRNLTSGDEHEIAGVDPSRGTFLAVAPGGLKAIVRTERGAVPAEYDAVTKELTPLPENVDWTSTESSSFTNDLRFYVGPYPDENSPTFRIVDRMSGSLTQAPLGSDGLMPNQASIPTSISDDGTVVAFSSSASNLVLGDTNGLSDAFVVKLAKGRFSDDDGNQFESDIEWLAAEGVTLGCGSELYCPDAPVTREQMASFLVRALELSPSATDAFGDDESSPHEADINALAAAGITQGCGPATYCPTGFVSRQEMASFLVRALQIGPSTVDHFTDDAGSIHEADIDALAEAGITKGCATGLFCPMDQVLRDQMAAFLHRSFG